ncbi:MAG TPA: TetR/AcrR family transcriptional regulator [Pseudonocardia sp.]|jgi:AcrR family transcriptional regulator|nr:TetR/AcrR family transcriptional regulator [Pseudonocardia sp.]
MTTSRDRDEDPDLDPADDSPARAESSGSDGDSCDYRSKPRRRGEELLSAIYQATVDELTEHGYADLTMDRVAARAKASKGSLYRRWPSRAELVVDAIRHTQVPYAIPPDSGDLRSELAVVLMQTAEALEGPRGEAVRGLIAEVFRHPDLMRTVRADIMDSALPAMLEVLRRGVVRGEVRPGALAEMVARVGPGLIRQQMMVYGTLGAGYLDEVLAQVVLPLVLAHSAVNTGDRSAQQTSV